MFHWCPINCRQTRGYVRHRIRYAVSVGKIVECLCVKRYPGEYPSPHLALLIWPIDTHIHVGKLHFFCAGIWDVALSKGRDIWVTMKWSGYCACIVISDLGIRIALMINGWSMGKFVFGFATDMIHPVILQFWFPIFYNDTSPIDPQSWLVNLFFKDGNHRNIWLLQISVVLHPYIVTKLIPFSLVQSYVPYNMVLQTQNVLPSYMLLCLWL